MALLPMRVVYHQALNLGCGGVETTSSAMVNGSFSLRYDGIFFVRYEVHAKTVAQS